MSPITIAAHTVLAALSDAEQSAVAALVETVNATDGLDLPIGAAFDELPEGYQTLFLAYEGEALAGAAVLDTMSEASVAVRPDARRRGTGRALLEAAAREAARRGRTSFLLVCDETADCGPAFAVACGGVYAFSEHSLLLDPAAIPPKRADGDGPRLVPATDDDLETLARLQAAAFDDPVELTREHVADGLQQPTRQYFLGMLGEEPIGLLRIGRYDGFADVTAFGVLPEYQGRGYGRRMLRDAIDILLAEGQPAIGIDVETENSNALGLYRSCGFQPRRTFAYYRLEATYDAQG